jgi:hypothetical protein
MNCAMYLAARESEQECMIEDVFSCLALAHETEKIVR